MIDVHPGDRVQLRDGGEELTVGTDWRIDCPTVDLYLGSNWIAEVNRSLVYRVLPRCPSVDAVVSSVEELDALPEESVVANDHAMPAFKGVRRWKCNGDAIPAGELVGARVLRVGGSA